MICCHILFSIVAMSTYKPVESRQRRGWFEIPGYSGYLARRDGMIFNKRTGHMTLGGNAGHYLKVYVTRDDTLKPSLEYSHELICLAFKGPRPPNHVVGHKDNNRFNTKAINLSWITQSKNIKDTYTDGLRQPTYGPRTTPGINKARLVEDTLIGIFS